MVKFYFLFWTSLHLQDVGMCKIFWVILTSSKTCYKYYCTTSQAFSLSNLNISWCTFNIMRNFKLISLFSFLKNKATSRCYRSQKKKKDCRQSTSKSPQLIHFFQLSQYQISIDHMNQDNLTWTSVQ